MPGFILQRYLNYCDFNRIVSRDYTVFFWLSQFEPYMQSGFYGDIQIIAALTVVAA